MNKLSFTTLLILLASIHVFAQQAPKQTSLTSATGRKVITIAGRSSDDGRIFLRNSDGKVWSINNPEMLKGHEGLPVVIQGQLEPNQSKELHVLSVKAGKSEVGYVTNWSDSAFRR
ncbi:MAG TPA: hypothetical protein VMB18_17880 [Terriglobales bacterium]|jgi:hypothetical protein|nr:hypothetical protein [Terriglobales bacterium]